mgnify:CR=1 FL=1
MCAVHVYVCACVCVRVCVCVCVVFFFCFRCGRGAGLKPVCVLTPILFVGCLLLRCFLLCAARGQTSTTSSPPSASAPLAQTSATTTTTSAWSTHALLRLALVLAAASVSFAVARTLPSRGRWPSYLPFVRAAQVRWAQWQARRRRVGQQAREPLPRAPTRSRQPVGEVA